MKKKGFTLIELLAVIVILAIIALIATPLVLKYIEYSKEKSAKLSAQTYAEAVEKEYVSKLIKNEKIPNGTYDIGQLDDYGVKVKGDKPEGDKDYVVLNNGNVIEYVLTINGYIITYDNGDVTVESEKDSNSNSKKIDAIDHTVTFTVDGEPYEIMSVKDGNSIIAPYNDPSGEDINFGGWADINGTPITFPLTPTKDTEIIAINWSLSDLLRNAYNINKNEYPYIYVQLGQTVQYDFYNVAIWFLSSYELIENGFTGTGIGYGYSRMYHSSAAAALVNDPVAFLKKFSSLTPTSSTLDGNRNHYGDVFSYTNFNCSFGATVGIGGGHTSPVTHYQFK